MTGCLLHELVAVKSGRVGGRLHVSPSEVGARLLLVLLLLQPQRVLQRHVLALNELWCFAPLSALLPHAHAMCVNATLQRARQGGGGCDASRARMLFRTRALLHCAFHLGQRSGATGEPQQQQHNASCARMRGMCEVCACV